MRYCSDNGICRSSASATVLVTDYLAVQVLAPLAIGITVTCCHFVAVPIDGCRYESLLITTSENSCACYGATKRLHLHKCLINQQDASCPTIWWTRSLCMFQQACTCMHNSMIWQRTLGIAKCASEFFTNLRYPLLLRNVNCLALQALDLYLKNLTSAYIPVKDRNCTASQRSEAN